MRLQVEPFIPARQFVPDGPAMAIRVFDPYAIKHPKTVDGSWTNGPAAPFLADLYNVVRTYTFEDVNYDLYEAEAVRCLMLGRELRPFSANMADDIVRHVVRHRDDIEILLVHCHAGLSRSVAIAFALDECLDLKAEWGGHNIHWKNYTEYPDYRGNSFVYRLVCEAAGRL